MQTVIEIEMEIAELEAKRQAALDEKRLSMVDDVAAIIGGASGDDLVDVFKLSAARHGISLAIKVSKPAKQKAPAKYRNPLHPGQEWSGRGKAPAWFDKARESEFLIVE